MSGVRAATMVSVTRSVQTPPLFHLPPSITPASQSPRTTAPKRRRSADKRLVDEAPLAPSSRDMETATSAKRARSSRGYIEVKAGVLPTSILRLEGDAPVPAGLDITGPTVEICVGELPARESFHVHKKLLIHSSLFFYNSLKPEWYNGAAIDLHDQIPRVFRAYSQWLYTSKVALRTDDLPRLYILGEFLQDTNIQNHLLITMVETFKSERAYPDPDWVREIYDGTPKGSPARRLCVDTWRLLCEPEAYEKASDDLPPEFCNELCVSMLQHPRKGDGEKALKSLWAEWKEYYAVAM